MSDSINERQSAPQTPPPGSYPESHDIRPSPSVASTSVKVKDEVKEIINGAKMVMGTMKGQPVVIFPKDSWRNAEDKLIALQERQGNSVSVSELAELQRELSELRLKANDFKTQNERLEYAQATLTASLNHAKAVEAKAKIEAQESLALLSGTQKELRASLAAVNAQKKEFEIAIKEAKRSGDKSNVEALLEDKRRLSYDVSALNDHLQQTNADKKNIQAKLKRFESQVLNLTSELNAEKSRHEIHSNRPGTSFAEKARGAKESTIKLYNIAHNNLSSLAKARFEKVKDDPTEDERNSAFWFKAVFDATKHEVYKPYKLIFGGMADDLKAYTVPSRKAFDRFLVAVRDSLLPTGQPLSMDDMTSMLGDIEQSQLRLNSKFREKGFNTLKDLTDHDLVVGAPDASDINFRLVNGILEPISTFKRDSKRPVRRDSIETLELRHEGVSPKSKPTLDEPIEDPDPISYWIRVRQWFHVQFDSMSTRIRESLRSRPKRLERYFKLSTGNFLQRFALVPYSWYIWAFP